MGLFDSMYRSGIGFWGFLFNRTTPVREVTPLGDVEKDNIIKKLAAERQSLKAQIGEYKAQEKEVEEDSKDEQIKEELIKRLNKKQEIIEEKRVGRNFSFGKFYARIFGVDFTKAMKKKNYFKESLEITDKDDVEVLGMFKDILSLNNGDLGLLDTNKQIIARGKTLSDIIWKPESLNNHMRRGRIPIPYNVDGNFVPDLENMQMPEIVYNEEKDDYDEAQEFTRPFKEMIIDREKEIQRLQKLTERGELLITKLTRQNDDLKRTSHVLKIRSEASTTELSKVMEKSLEYDKRIGEMHRKIVALSETNAMKEIMKERLEHINRQLMEKVEELGVKSDFEKITTFMQDIIEWAKQVTPEQIVQYAEKPGGSAQLPTPDIVQK